MTDRLPERVIPSIGNDAVPPPSVDLAPPLRVVIPLVIPPMIPLVIPLMIQAMIPRVIPPLVDDRWLYRRFRDYNPPTFSGSLDPQSCRKLVRGVGEDN